MYIYKTTNKIDSKFYIGKCERSIDESVDYYGSGLLLKRAIKKYGIENFKKEIIYQTDDKKDLDENEIYYIKFYNAIELGYNIAHGGSGGNTNGKHPNKIFIYKKISISNSGQNHYLNKLSEDERKNYILKYRAGKNNPLYGKPKTEKQMKSSIKNGKTNFLGKKHTEETKEKMRTNGKGKNKGDKNVNYNKRGDKNHCSKTYIITYPDGNEEKITGIKEFCRVYNNGCDKNNRLHPQNLSSVAKGKYKHHKGFKIKYYNG